MNPVAAFVARAIEEAVGLAALNRLYRRLPATQPLWDAALGALDIRYELAGDGSGRIPPAGPLVVVANHPYGGADGLILLSLLARIRPDVKLMANLHLWRVPELRPFLLPVDPFGRASKRAVNAAAARSAIRWVRSGGTLAVFPAGEVAHEAAENGPTCRDARWSAGVARIIQRTGADVVPVFFEGGNSQVFRLAGRIHPLLRTVLLPRELLRQRGRTVRVRVGTRIPSARLSRFEEPDALASYLSVRTAALAAEPGRPRTLSGVQVRPVAEPQDPREVERELAALDASSVLLRSGPFDVLIARAHEVPRTMLEIGRLREMSFRRAGEGTALARDLDGFDAHYRHLFVWNRERAEIAGAYRVGATDDIVPRAGAKGLYTSTLFRYDQRLLSQLDPALELGRAFVTPEYQQDYSPLLLLWKGIGAFVVQNPRYRMLFGPVSISNSYQSLSRQILVRFLQATSYRQDLGELVSPRNPPAFLRYRGGLVPAAGSMVRSLAEVGTLLAEIESDGKGVPVLLRQYLKLKARLLGFNLDPSFGSVIDGLMLVDLTDVDRALLVRYMGAEGASAFLRYHGAADRRRAS